jgi:hypothetical protein
MSVAEMKKLTFEVEGSEPQSGYVRNPSATLGTVASQVAGRMGLAGTFECLYQDQTLSPETPLEDLPDEATIRLSPQYTPA